MGVVVMPRRIQRQRTKGWRKPEGCVDVTRGSRWGNPFVVGKDGTAEECVAKYAAMMLPYTHQPPRNTTTDFMISSANMEAIVIELAGKDLMCWCKEGAPCHGDWLLSVANDPQLRKMFNKKETI